MARPTKKKSVSDYAQVAADYRDGVRAGTILASEWVKKACEREFQDQERAKRGWTYHYDPARANEVCEFIEKLPHVKGSWASRGERLKLQPWQVFILCTVFGWLNGADLRRYRTCYIEVPRKNGKSSLSAAVALYCFVMDGETGAEVCAAGTSRDSSRIVWRTAYEMLQASPELVEAAGLQLMANAIVQPSTNSTFKALSAEDRSIEGKSIHFAAVDELHLHRSRAVWDSLENATGARQQSLTWAISTAGYNQQGICFEIRTYLQKVLDGVTPDETFFGVIHCADPADDWQARTTWAKANPNLNVSVFEDDLQRLAAKAARTPSAQNTFLTKRLDLWVTTDTALFSMAGWAACADPGLKLVDFQHERCIVAVDLAPRHDFCAMAVVFRRDDEYYVFVFHYLNEAEVHDSPHPQYEAWARQGIIKTCPGNATDYAALEEDIETLAKAFEVAEVCYDPFNAHQFATRMQERGFTMIEIRAIVRNFSEATQQLDALIASGKIHHTGCPLLAWQMSNVAGHYDRKGNVYPVKTHGDNKIDGPIALIMALGRAMAEPESGGSVYDDPDQESPWL